MSLLDRVLGRAKVALGARTGDIAMSRSGEQDLVADEAAQDVRAAHTDEHRDRARERQVEIERERSTGAYEDARTRAELESQAASAGAKPSEHATREDLVAAIETPPGPTAEHADPHEVEVAVRDPHLSDRANEALTDEVRAQVGTRASTSRAQPGREVARQHSSIGAALINNRLPIAITFGLVVVLGGVLALTTGQWLFLVLALGLHAVGTALVLTVTMALVSNAERPDPKTVALLEDEGVSNPERVYSEALHQFRPNRTSTKGPP